MKKEILPEVLYHYEMVKEDNNIRQTRENGWNDVIDAYWGKLPNEWPFDSRVSIPIIRTSLTEKNARLINSKLRGRLIPREGGDVLKAKINNAILDFQWESANYGGSMMSKWKEMDMDTRLMGSMFGLTLWRHCEYVEGKKVEVEFDGNEFTPLNMLDCGIDPNCKNIKDAKWFQHRKWSTIEELETENDISMSGKIYPGLGELKKVISYAKDGKGQTQDRRDNEYQDRIKSLKGIQDRMGQDREFPVVEIVTEYRPDRWITFAPKHKVILRDIENPYEHGKIPVVQLNYYKLQDDPIGESEVEPVLPLWRCIMAVVNAYLDTMILHMRPPLIGVEGQFRQETIKYGSEEVWVVNNPNAITEFRGNTDSLQYFQTTFGALLSQFNNAMGDLSQGTGAMDPFSPDKTATEVKATVKQQNVRDQSNQNDLAEAIKDMMMMWVSNNKQFLFSDPTKKEYVIRIIGSEAYAAFKKAGMDEMVIPDDVMSTVADIVANSGGEMTDPQVQMLMESGQVPKFPIIKNPKEKNPENYEIKPKMEVDENGNEANLTIVPEDLDGTFSYIADVKSMSSTFADEQMKGQTQAIQLLTNNPAVLQLLQGEGYKPNIKELLVKTIEGFGDTDGERYFSRIEQAAPAGPALNGTQQQPGLQGVPSALPPEMLGQQMAGPAQLPQPEGVLQGVPPVQG
jgi:hypothetical protein